MTNDELLALEKTLRDYRSASERRDAAGIIVRWRRPPYDPDCPFQKEYREAAKQAEELWGELEGKLCDAAEMLIIMYRALQIQHDDLKAKVAAQVDWTEPRPDKGN